MVLLNGLVDRDELAEDPGGGTSDRIFDCVATVVGAHLGGIKDNGGI